MRIWVPRSIGLNWFISWVSDCGCLSHVSSVGLQTVKTGVNLWKLGREHVVCSTIIQHVSVLKKTIKIPINLLSLLEGKIYMCHHNHALFPRKKLWTNLWIFMKLWCDGVVEAATLCHFCTFKFLTAVIPTWQLCLLMTLYSSA